MYGSNEWIETEITKMGERKGEMPANVLASLADLLERKLSIEPISKAELTKIADRLLVEMSSVEGAKEDTVED